MIQLGDGPAKRVWCGSLTDPHKMSKRNVTACPFVTLSLWQKGKKGDNSLMSMSETSLQWLIAMACNCIAQRRRWDKDENWLSKRWWGKRVAETTDWQQLSNKLSPWNMTQWKWKYDTTHFKTQKELWEPRYSVPQMKEPFYFSHKVIFERRTSTEVALDDNQKSWGGRSRMLRMTSDDNPASRTSWHSWLFLFV